MNNRETPGHVLGWRVGRSLTLITIALLLASGLLYVAMVLAVRDDWPAEGETPDGLPGVVFRLWTIVDVSVEGSAPTWFNALLWAVLGLVALAAAALARRRAGCVAFSTVALLASLDEATSLHERLQEFGWPLAEAFGWGLVYAWVIPGVLIAVVVAACLWPLVHALPRTSRRLIVAGGVVFLLGAVVVETLSGQLVGHHGTITWQNMLLTHVEEAMEKIGLILAIVGVVRLFSREHSEGRVVVVFDDPERQRDAPAGGPDR